MKVGIIESSVLSVLLRHGEGHSLQLIDHIHKDAGVSESGVKWTAGKLSQGRIYRALRNLQNEDLVTSRFANPGAESGGWPRVYYNLTEAGKALAKGLV